MEKKKETLVTLAPRQVIDFKEWTVSPDNQISIKPEAVVVKNFNMSGNGQTIKVEGSTRKTAAGKTELDFAVDIDRLNYNNFDIFVAGILSDLGGWAEAHLKIKGNTDAMQVRGKLQLHEAFFTPALTNVRYELSDTPIEFTNPGLRLTG